MLRALFALLLVLTPLPALAEAWAAAREPGAVLLLRHATAPGTGDPADFRLEDCATQRNLNAAGRTQARRIGAALAAAGAVPDRILTSQWCRTRETAELLGLGPVADWPVLNSFFGEMPNEPAQTLELRRYLAEEAAGERLLLVTHQVNITALTGIVPRSGEIVVMSRDDLGRLSVAGRIPPP